MSNKIASPFNQEEQNFTYKDILPKDFLSPNVEQNNIVPNIFTMGNIPSEEKREPEVDIVPGRVPSSPPPQEIVFQEPEKAKRELHTLKSFIPSITLDRFFSETDSCNMDGTFPILEYLSSIGYDSTYWVLGPEFKNNNCHKEDGTPVCIRNTMKYFTVRDIVEYSKDHSSSKGYYPPKPIIALSHPCCNCSLQCYPSQNIPDNAPGIPLYAPEEVKNNYKLRLFLKLRAVKINRWSALSQADLDKYIRSYSVPYIYRPKSRKKEIEEKLKSLPNIPKEDLERLEREYSYYSDRIKFSSEDWKEDIKPVRTNSNFLYFQDPFILQPIPSGYVGFQIESTEDKSRIFLTELGYDIVIPKNYVEYLSLKEEKYVPDANDFIKVDDELAIILKYEDYENPYCYFPSFEEFMEVGDDYKTFKILGD